MNENKAREYAELTIEKICNDTRIPCLAIQLTDGKPSIFESKIGGIPYLPKDAAIPTDKNGKSMQLLAQINCKDLIQLEDYPHAGILQFWLTTDYEWEEYFVTYYQEIDRYLTEEDILMKMQNNLSDNEGSFPVDGECGMEFILKEETMSSDDCRLEALFCQYYTEISGEYITMPEDAGDGEYGEVVYDIWERYCDNAYGGDTKIGGYELTTQFQGYATYRPKEYATQFNSPWKTYVEEIDLQSDDTDVLLFQLTSHRNHAANCEVMWGDAGVGRFYIKRRDLKNCDFSKVWFSWDCS